MYEYLATHGGNFVGDDDLISLYSKIEILEAISEANQRLTIDDHITEEINVSDIPPSLLFAAINNTYSSGFMLYIPIDMTFSEFIEWNTSRYINEKQCSFVGAKLLDFEYLNSYGKIRSSSEWDRSARILGYIWDIDNKSVGTIKSIVNNCRNIYMKYLGNT